VTELPPPSPGIGRDKDIVTLGLSFEFGAEAARVFSILGDEGQWPEELPVRILKRQPHTKLIVALPDFTRAEIAIEPTPDGCEVALVHDLIKSAEDKKEYRKLWNAWFKQIEKRVSL
jgi:HSP20 family molecular chaperone IbpA